MFQVPQQVLDRRLDLADLQDQSYQLLLGDQVPQRYQGYQCFLKLQLYQWFLENLQDR